ncbi:MAG: glycosyltransferase [Candidatus Dadabacteria bacterium]|nr:glycosyltransferase [Candidatus Dadabacteria bacterium]
MITTKHLRTGGAERQIVNLANGLSERGSIEVCLFALEKGGTLFEELAPEVKVEAGIKSSKLASKFLLLPLAAKRLRPDVIYTRTMTMPSLIAGRMWGIPVVIAEINNPEKRMGDGKGRKWQNRLTQKTARNFASMVVANCRGLADAAQEFWSLKSKPRAIYNGIDIEQIERRATADANHPWITDKKTPLIVSVGRVVPGKDFTTLARAFALLKQTTDARLIIVGGGTNEEEKTKLSAAISENNLEDCVSLAGERDNPHPFMRAADVYVSSSAYEGFSNSILEALALGVPIVSTDHQFGANEMIEDGKSGLLVPVGDTESMAGAIERVLKDGNLRQNLATGAKERAQNFTLEKAVVEHEKLFREITGKPT